MQARAPLLALFVLGLLAACTAQRPLVESADPSVIAAASPATMSAGSPVAESPEPSPSPMPSAVPSAAAGPAAGTPLAQLLPLFAGSAYLDEQALDAGELVANGDRLAFGRLMSDLSLEPADLEVLMRSSSEITLLAVRAEGVSGDELADAYVAAVLEALPGSTLADVEVEPATLQRVVAEQDGEVASLTLLPRKDAIVIAAAERANDDLVDLTLSRMLHPGPERLLPTKLDDRPLQITAIPGEAAPVGGDVCAIICPGELQAMAADLGVELSEVRFAFGLLQDPPAIAVLAFEFPGARTEDLMAIREKLGSYGQFWQRSAEVVGGKDVLRYRDSTIGDPGREQWVYARDGVLYVIHVEPVEGDGVPPVVEEALGALP